MYNKLKSSIQDPIHHRVLNPINPYSIEESTNWLVDADVRQIDQVWDNSSHGNNQISQKLMSMKYEFEPFPWTSEKIMNAPKRTKCDNFITYPYFEKDIYNLKEKGYII